MESTSLEPFQDAEPGGRQSILAWLSGQLSRAENGISGVVCLSGNPGVGKTWLLDRLAEYAEARAITVLRGGSLEAEGMPPYLPFLEALGAYVCASQPEVLRRQLGVGPQLLARLLPEIELKLQRLPRGPNLAPEQARLRLFDAVADFLRAIADPRAAVLLRLTAWTERIGSRCWNTYRAQAPPPYPRYHGGPTGRDAERGYWHRVPRFHETAPLAVRSSYVPPMSTTG